MRLRRRGHDGKRQYNKDAVSPSAYPIAKYLKLLRTCLPISLQDADRRMDAYMIFCTGSINVDFIFANSRWPIRHEKYRTGSYVCANGGSAANTTVELSRLGRKVTIVGGTG
jgi:hypothetical protein